MSEQRAQKTRNRLAKIYAAGVLVFVAIFGFITLFALFVSHLK